MTDAGPVFTDPLDSRTWFAHVLRSIAGIHCGDFTAAREYMAFVAEHRGDAAVPMARATLNEYSKTTAFANAAQRLHKLENPHVQTRSKSPAEAPPAKTRPKAARVSRGGLFHRVASP